MLIGKHQCAVILLLSACSALVARGQGLDEEPKPTASAARTVLAGIEEPSLQELVLDVLERNALVAVSEARARAARERAPRAGAWPRLTAGLTAFLETPETRTGPQLLSVSFSQRLPWKSKLALKEQAALYAAVAVEAEIDIKRLDLITQTRRLYYELVFLERYREISGEFRAHLLQHEEISRARYSTGVGGGQEVVKLQAEITRVENRLLDIDTRRVALTAEINALRDRPAASGLPSTRLPQTEEILLDLELLLDTARRQRPELRAADARVANASTHLELAEKSNRPDFKVGLVYTVVDPRDDLLGRLQPPESNGDDIVGIQGGITLPIWHKARAAEVEEAVQQQAAVEESKRALLSTIEAAVGDLTQRVPLGWRQLRLVEDLLIVQAEEALESAQAGYIAGTLNALELLDAEHVLFEARTAVARARTDYLIGLAQLEGAVGASLQAITTTEQAES